MGWRESERGNPRKINWMLTNEYIYLTNKITINQTAFCFTPQETAECLPDDADDGVHVNLCPIEI